MSVGAGSHFKVSCIMASNYIIRLGAIKGKDGILIALKHNKRELNPSGNIISNKSSLNYCLAGDDSSTNIARHAKAQMQYVGIEVPRKNGVMAVEIIFSLPIDRQQQDTRPFFNDCLEWVKKNFDAEMLSFDVHLDETAPHAHAILLPLINEKMRGSSLIGGRGNLMRLINLFHKEVAGKYGLSKADKSSLSVIQKQSLERHVLTMLKADPIMKSCIWPIVRDLIHQNPLQFTQPLAINLEAKKKSLNETTLSHRSSRIKDALLMKFSI
jgi:hypothetical protein